MKLLLNVILSVATVSTRITGSMASTAESDSREGCDSSYPDSTDTL